MQEIVSGYQTVNDYLQNLGIQYYYFQCWDKQSIYPEQFPDSLIQYGKESRTDQRISEMILSNITVISPKKELIDAKSEYETYSVWGDPAHWTQRGSFIGYQTLMNEINTKNDNQFHVLAESDYDISVVDQGYTLFGGIHQKNLSENFSIKNPQAYLSNEKLILYSDDERHRFFTNDSVDNNICILILGDSYFNSFIVDDIAESFYETVMIWGDYTENLVDIIETYNPDIVVNECAERVDRSGDIVKLANQLKDRKAFSKNRKQ